MTRNIWDRFRTTIMDRAPPPSKFDDDYVHSQLHGNYYLAHYIILMELCVCVCN